MAKLTEKFTPTPGVAIGGCMEEKELKEAIKSGQGYTDVIKSITTNWKKTKLVSYKMPWLLWLKSKFSTPFYLFFMLIVASILLKPSLVINGYYSHALLTLVFLLIVIHRFYYANNSIIRNWLVENVRCPACNGRIKSCLWRTNWTNPAYEVQCRKCNRKFLFRGNLRQFVLTGESTAK